MPPKKKKANIRGNKGGCKVGRKDESPKGGCKIGKRDPNKPEKTVAMMAAFQASRKNKVAADKAKSAPKKPVKKPTSRPKSAPRTQTGGMPKSKLAAKAGIKAGDRLPFKKKPKKKAPAPDEYKRKVKVGSSDRTTRSAPAAKGVIKDTAAKKARIQEKVRALGKKQVEKKKEKKKDFTAKPKLPNFENFLAARAATFSRPLKDTEKKAFRRVFDRELLLRDASGGWEGGSSKEEMKRYRKEHGGEVAGIDFEYTKEKVKKGIVLQSFRGIRFHDPERKARTARANKDPAFLESNAGKHIVDVEKINVGGKSYYRDDQGQHYEYGDGKQEALRNPKKVSKPKPKPKGQLQYLYESEAAAKATDRSRSQKVYVEDYDKVRNEKGKVIGKVGEGIWNAMSDQDGLYIDRRGM